MFVISHRGHHVSVPENTMEAFEAAIDLGVDGIETDVRLSADGRAVLYHDRLAPDGREVRGLTRDELSVIAGYCVPTLEEAMSRFDGVRWFVEVKTPMAADATVAVLRRRYRSRRCMVISRWRDVVRQIRKRIPVPGGLVVPHPSLHPVSTLSGWLKRTGVRTLVWNYKFLDARQVEQAVFEGYLNLAYGPVTADEHQGCVELGVDGIITDDPEQLLAPAGGRRSLTLPACPQ